MNLKLVGKRIQDARNEQGITQEQLAELVEVSPTHISVLERGVKAPRLDTFVRIANALHVSADSLLFDVLEDPPAGSEQEIPALLARLPLREQRRLLRLLRALTEESE